MRSEIPVQPLSRGLRLFEHDEPSARLDWLRALFQPIVDETNADLASFEQVKRFVLLPAQFCIDSGELTPALKLKRRVVMERWRGSHRGHLRGRLSPRRGGPRWRPGTERTSTKDAREAPSRGRSSPVWGLGRRSARAPASSTAPGRHGAVHPRPGRRPCPVGASPLCVRLTAAMVLPRRIHARRARTA